MQEYDAMESWMDDPVLPNIKTNNVINVSWPERLLSATTGVALIGSGVRNFTKHPVRSFMQSMIGGFLLYRGASGSCPAYAAMGKTRNVHRTPAINVRETIVVRKPRHEVYRFWRNLENLPSFMHHLARVREVDPVHSRWEAIVPANLGRVRWNAEIVKDEYGVLIGWQSIAGSAIENAGKVEFRDADDGTEVRVTITYRPPAGDIGVVLAKLLNPAFARIVEKDIRQFKAYIEGITPAEFETAAR
ncbi:SRPBCC family protein [Paraflavitalea sp. CAU 1676]|uniref:SRPBCC family protein n=1 Tax=Paraflavitalea sp. CAU 1676 TaxID=3032598 RepID=UPI0023DA5010|nr:SRPBCC family protein [Paraflavitalea sp. CAU 1676]MDF2188906.1 SRPBCC family protein [Paraflavitalea sp. CAU 1676]